MADVSTTTAPVSPESNGQAQVEREQVQTAWVGAINEETGTGVQVAVKSTEDEQGNTTYQVQGANGQPVTGTNDQGEQVKLEISQDQARLLSDDDEENDADVYNDLRAQLSSLQFAPSSVYDLQAKFAPGLSERTLAYDPKDASGESIYPDGRMFAEMKDQEGRTYYTTAAGDQAASVVSINGEPVRSQEELEQYIKSSAFGTHGIAEGEVSLGEPEIETRRDREEAEESLDRARPRNNESPKEYLQRLDDRLFYARNNADKSEPYLQAAREYVQENIDAIMADPEARDELLNLADDIWSGALVNDGTWDGIAYDENADIETLRPQWQALADELGEPAGPRLRDALEARHLARQQVQAETSTFNSPADPFGTTPSSGFGF